MMVEFIFTAGPLGSGKTTFINAIAPGLERTGRIGAAISDLGAINDDVRRVRINGDITGFKAGCVCCERKQDLESLVGKIDSSLDYFVVEPSGASNVYDMIQVVQEAAATTRPDFSVNNVFTMVPVASWEQVKSLRALQAGVQSASTIVLTKTHSGDLEKVNSALDRLGATNSRIIYNAEPTGLSYMLSKLPTWQEPTVEVGRGHEHFKRISFSIPQDATRDEVVRKLERLNELGVARAKGVVPGGEFEFDLSYGQITTSPYQGNQIAPRGTVIFNGEPEGVVEVINSFDIGGASDVSHSVSGATLPELLQTFHYHYRFTDKTSPSVEGRVRANFEGTDDAYTLGKEIYLRTNGKESAPLEMALSPYLNIRYNGLQALEDSSQSDRAYVGVMLASYMIQMLGDKDGVPFNQLTESKWTDRIRADVAPAYFKHLGHFGKSDLGYFAPDDKHFPFFVWMAERAAPYADRELVTIGSKNMARVHNNEISERWENLADG